MYPYSVEPIRRRRAFAATSLRRAGFSVEAAPTSTALARVPWQPPMPARALSVPAAPLPPAAPAPTPPPPPCGCAGPLGDATPTTTSAPATTILGLPVWAFFGIVGGTVAITLWAALGKR